MKRSHRMSGVKALAMTTALAGATMLASTAAQADVYNYTLFETAAVPENYSGSFEATITGLGSDISSSSAITITSANGTFGLVFAPIFPTPSTITSINSTLNLNNGVGSFLGTIFGTGGIAGNGVDATSTSAQGPITGTSSSFSFGNSSLGLFSAVDVGFEVGPGEGTGAVPEPSTWAMMLLGFGGLGFLAFRKARRITLCRW